MFHILVGIFIVVAVLFLARPIWITGDSMNPNFQNGQLEIFHYTSSVERGDVIVFFTDSPISDKEKRTRNIFQKILYGDSKILIKRVIGVEGDKIHITNGNIFITGVLQEKEPWTDGEISVNLSKNEFFVLGDNREKSIDSRNSEVGIVKRNAILGKLW